MRLAIITTHPIQYNAPMFKLLAERGNLNIKVFYTWGEGVMRDKFDPGFGRTIKWDIPLLEGYDYVFVNNIAERPGSDHFRGIDTPSLNADIKTWGADALLVYGWSFKSHLSVIRHFKGKIPVYFRGDSTLLDERPGLRRQVRRLFLRWIYSHVDKAFYVGQQNKRYYLAHGLKEQQLIPAPHAIDNSRFRNITKDDEKRILVWREELGFRPSDFVVIFCGKFEPNKQPEFLLRLADQLQDHPRIKFLMVGNGALEGELKRRARADNRFVFLDFQNQGVMPLVYRLGDVFILPSRSETWGLAINEAMVCALPVIASEKCGGAVDLIKDYDNGIVFSDTDLYKVSSYILSLSAFGAELERARKASVKRIESFSFAAIAEAVENCALSVNSKVL